MRTAQAREPPPRPLVLLRLETADGLVGFGEAAPLAHYDGVTLEAVLGALRTYTPILAAATTEADPGLLAACRRARPVAQALAAVDLALWDLAGQRAGQPVWRLLGADVAAPVAVNAVIGAVLPAAAAAEAAAALEAGYDTVKVKVAAGDDGARIAAVREAIGSGPALRVDANGGWAGVAVAVAEIEALAGAHLELVEEPVHGAAGIAAVAQRVTVPVFGDESAPELLTGSGAPPAAVSAPSGSGPHPAAVPHSAVAGVCLKVAAAGGISGLLTQAHRAREAGWDVLIASTLDGPLGIAAALHAAVAVAPARACGLATLDRFAATNPLPVRAGRLNLPGGPGLGGAFSAWYGAHGI